MADIVRLWGAVDYKPDLRFFDNMYKVAKDIGKDFKHWWTDRMSIGVHDYERKDYVMVSSKRIAFETLNPQNIVQTCDRLSGIVRSTMLGLNCNTLTRMGLKICIFADLGLSFDEIKEQVRPICLPKENRLEDITSSEVLDFQLQLNYKWEKKIGMLRISPMNKEQGIQDIRNIGDIEKFFPDIGKSPDFLKFLNSVPESFLGFDLDMYVQGEEFDSNQWPIFCSTVIPHIMGVFQGIKSIVLEK